MKKILSAILLTLVVSATVFAQEPPKREFRGAWLHIVGNQKIKDMSREEIQQWFTSTLDTLKDCGCNAIIFQVRPEADAFYESSLEPWTRFLTGEQGKAPDPYWDPLQFMIDESHARGMELHAWLNPYRVTTNDKEQLHPDHLYFRKPEIFKRYGKQLFFDPGEPEARDFVVKVIADIVTRYDVDAIHFDDYFYPYPVKYEEFHDDASFIKYGASQGFEYWQKNDWRRNNVELLIHQINDTIKAIKPWIRFGISPFGIHRNVSDDPKGSKTNGLSNYEQLFADVPGWADKGYIDYIVPQLYWKIGHAVADYEVLINWWNDSNFKGHLYIGQNIGSFNAPDLDNPEITQTERKMQLERDLPNVDGNVWWPGWTFNNPAREGDKFRLKDSLQTNYQKNIALIPAYTDLDSVEPAPVKSIKRSNGAIAWTVTPTDDVMQQPHFFVVYRFAAKEKIDIANSGKIVKITRDNSFKPEGKRDGKYKYVVTVVDKCWNESTASKAITW
ncbi:MAG: family 10 glycosylhydrolase [Bacteroidales bacterium]|nr:family 10 glycosylhydrolase [Candidatus Cacconaster merdequi]